MSTCKITGENNCKCLYETKTHIETHLKEVLRKLFTDHAVYTSFVLKSIVDGTKDDCHRQASSTTVFLDRLLLNQKDIGDQLKSHIGVANGNKLTKLLTTHIKLAGAVMTSAVKNDKNLQKNIDSLFLNSDQVAAFLTSLNSKKLPYKTTQSMFHMHNQYVIDMTVARIHEDFHEEQLLYDSYYNELLSMSDAIYEAL
jgi:hypothetical protein